MRKVIPTGQIGKEAHARKPLPTGRFFCLASPARASFLTVGGVWSKGVDPWRWIGRPSLPLRTKNFGGVWMLVSGIEGPEAVRASARTPSSPRPMRPSTIPLRMAETFRLL